MKEFTYNINQIADTAKYMLKNTKSKVIAFEAPMGAGKTTLIKSLIKELGGMDDVSSPTFGLVNEYAKVNGEALGYHFDFYRLTDEMEALDIGLEDYLNTDLWVFIEWPEKIPNLVPENAQVFKIEILDEITRKITMP